MIEVLRAIAFAQRAFLAATATGFPPVSATPPKLGSTLAPASHGSSSRTAISHSRADGTDNQFRGHLSGTVESDIYTVAVSATLRF